MTNILNSNIYWSLKVILQTMVNGIKTEITTIIYPLIEPRNCTIRGKKEVLI